jgi:predicted permease
MSTRGRGPRADDDFAREIEAHLAHETDQRMEDGMSADDARDAARRRFGNVALAKERYYESRRILWFDHLWHDVRCAFRNMRRYPVTSAVAILSLAAGIGATTVTLTIRDVVFYRAPVTYQDPARLSRIQVASAADGIRPFGGYAPAPLYAMWSNALGPRLAGAAGARDIEIRTADRTELLRVRAVTPGFLPLLGVTPSIGQPLESADPAAAKPAMLSHRAWQRLFDGRADVVGRPLWIDNEPFVVAGVLPQRFWFADTNTAIWTSLDPRTLRPDEGLEAVARREAGESPSALEARLRPGLEEFSRSRGTNDRQWLVRAAGIEGTPIGGSVSFVLPYLLGTAVFLTLIIACANVAVLMIAQWTAREHEIAIRASIGASRSRIVRSLLTESIVIAFAGAAFGVCMTLALQGVVLSRSGDDIAFFDLSIDPRIFAQTAVIALMAGLAGGILPAVFETRRLQTNPLRSMVVAERVRQRWRHALVVLEITVTVALLVVTTTMVNGYLRTRQAIVGYQTTPLVSTRIENRNGVAMARTLDVVRHLPGVASAAAATTVPYGLNPQERVATDSAGTTSVMAQSNQITADYFTTLGVPVKSGRTFDRDDEQSGRSVIVNEALAAQLFQGRDAIGGHLWLGSTPYDVIGIVANYSSNPLREAESEARLFLPLNADVRKLIRVNVLARAAGDPAPLVAVLRTELPKTSVGTLVASAFTIDQLFTIMGQEILAGTAPLFPLITIGMLLTTAGIYGVLAFAIARRSRELAVRMAVGASGWDIVKLVSAQTLRLIVTGAALGILLTYALARVVRAQGGAGSIYDPSLSAFVVPIAIAFAIGLIATWVPSRRARRIDPVVLLRTI